MTAPRLRDALKTFLLISCLTATSFAVSPARATEKIDTLTEENVRAFIEKTTELTAGKNSEMTADEIADYLDAHIEKRARFKSTMKYNIPGYPQQETALNLEKRDFMDNVKKGTESVTDYESAIEIDSIQISSKGDKATVTTTSTESGMMPLSVDGTTTDIVPIEGSSNCTQILTLEDGVIQMYGANCVTVVNFLAE